MTAIKICGIRTIEHARAAAEMGTDMLGFVFAPSRRQITPEQAKMIISAVRQHETVQRVTMVGLFVNEQPDQINSVVKSCGLDVVQLSGDETPEQAAAICCPVIKSLRLDDTDQEHAWLDAVSVRHSPVHFAACPLIVDAHVPGAYGGTGVLADWQRASILARTQRLMLAGGLTPENVAAAVRQVCPWGVDVSSGVERDGQKDVSRIDAFIRAVRVSHVS